MHQVLRRARDRCGDRREGGERKEGKKVRRKERRRKAEREERREGGGEGRVQDTLPDSLCMGHAPHALAA